MARDLGTVQTGEQTTLRAENPWIWLYEVEVPTDPPTRFRLTNYTEDVEYGFDGASDPIIYSRFPVSAGDIVQGKDGDLPGSGSRWRMPPRRSAWSSISTGVSSGSRRWCAW